jgi:hypothetical protein
VEEMGKGRRLDCSSNRSGWKVRHIDLCRSDESQLKFITRWEFTLHSPSQTNLNPSMSFVNAVHH